MDKKTPASTSPPALKGLNLPISPDFKQSPTLLRILGLEDRYQERMAKQAPSSSTEAKDEDK